MFNNFRIRALFAVLFLCPLMMTAAEPTIDEIFQNNIKARGGEKINTVKSFVCEANIVVYNTPLPVKILTLYPDKSRVEMTVMGQTLVKIRNGKKGWEIKNGKTEDVPEEKVLANSNRSYKQGGIYCRTYMNYKELGLTYEVLGTEDVKGVPAYKVKETTKEGVVTYIYFSTKDFLEVKFIIRDMDKNTDNDIYILENKDYDGIVLPSKFEIATQNMPGTFEILSYKFNEEIDNKLFEP